MAGIQSMEFPQECSWKTHVEWLGGNQKNIWLFGLVSIIHLPAPKIFFKFPKICEAEERTYLNSIHKSIQCNSLLKFTCNSDVNIRADFVVRFSACYVMAAGHAEDFQIYVLERP